VNPGFRHSPLSPARFVCAEQRRTARPRSHVFDDLNLHGSDGTLQPAPTIGWHRSVQPRMAFGQPARGLPGRGVLEQAAVLAVATHELHPDRQSRVREAGRNGDGRVGGDGDARAHAHPPED
jgi:hypothetical protein